MPESRFLSLFAFSDIPDDDGKELSAAGLHLRNRRFHWEFLTVCSETRQCAQGIYRTIRNASLGKVMDMSRECGTEAGGDEALDGGSNRILDGTAEHPLSGAVEHNNSLFLVDGDNRIHRRADDAFQTVLALE